MAGEVGQNEPGGKARQVKRFFAADRRIAMKMVRDGLGADAVIIGNRRVAGGVELTAVLDYPMQSAPAANKPNPALEAELRKTQSRLATAHAELSAAPRAKMQDRQLVYEKPAVAASKEHGRASGRERGCKYVEIS